MWYFAWLLGLPLAAAFAVLNGMWFELTEDNDVRRALISDTPAGAASAANNADKQVR